VHRLMNEIETAYREMVALGAEATPELLPRVAEGRPSPLRRRTASAEPRVS